MKKRFSDDTRVGISYQKSMWIFGRFAKCWTDKKQTWGVLPFAIKYLAIVR